jgi:hypothetical protein
MKQKLPMFVIHQTATNLQRTNNLNPTTRWYPTLDESNRMKSTYFTIHPSKNPPSQNGCWFKSVFLLHKHRFHILHFPNSTGLFTKPTGRHYTKYRFSPDIALKDHRYLPVTGEGGLWNPRWFRLHSGASSGAGGTFGRWFLPCDFLTIATIHCHPCHGPPFPQSAPNFVSLNNPVQTHISNPRLS